ncbi:hypothetical protein M2283_005453 [Streptomyces pseudovenezuelae]|uniref:Uncharacterized protein n=1 Tax=Streptomyces pseudovenezuelae TaxID=67350 RepID=A0ABT6LP81_9ACTN|nr:hypothetical protein [Streptomyces pseudovenezuelae]
MLVKAPPLGLSEAPALHIKGIHVKRTHTPHST